MAMQEHWIDKLDQGKWARHLRVVLGLLLLLALMLGYNWRGYHNLNTEEAMETAQLARNLSEGNGYTTLYIRPYSLHLVHDRNVERYLGQAVPTNADFYGIKETMHPDVSNPPLYPTVLAGWMKVYPLVLTSLDFFRQYTPWVNSHMPPIDQDWENRLWESNGRFSWVPQDYFIAVFNQVLFLLAAVMTYRLARRLFDLNVARLSVAALLGCELMWRFSVSGLSTLFLMVIFLALVWSLVLLDEEFREPRRTLRGMLLLTMVPGLLLGLGVLTTYAFGWLLIPVLAFIMAFSGRRWKTMGVITVIIFSAMFGPWVFRNVMVSGLPFGTRTFDIIQGTIFPEQRLERSLNPDFKGNYFRASLYKVRTNMENIVEEKLPLLGGSWVMPFFLVGLLLRFRNPGINHLRHFILWSALVMVVAQAAGRTQVSVDSPEVNSENLLVLLTPLVLVYGASLFFILLDQMELAVAKLRYVIIGVFLIVVCMPLLGVMVGWKKKAQVYPPYAPDIVKRMSSWMKENELVMSDIPGAVAWYGNRQCVLLTLDAENDFFGVNDYVKPVRCLYLTQKTADIRLYSDWLARGERSWGSFVGTAMFSERIPSAFPLRNVKLDLLPGQVVCLDRKRWEEEPETSQEQPKPEKEE